MNSRLTCAAALLAVASLSAVPAHAGTKPKPPIHKTYSVTLMPDPTADALDQVPGAQGCSGASPQGVNKHVISVPAKGRLEVVLDSPDPTGHGVTDWDLYVLDTDGSVYNGSHGGTSHESTSDKFKKAQKVTIEVCNLAGQPNATVSWTFTYA